MSLDFQQTLQKYAELVVQFGLNLQPGQRLLIRAPIQTAPLVRLIAACAYQRGARLVDVLWEDEAIELIRFQYAPRDSFEEFPAWKTDGSLEYVKGGGALLAFAANDPELFKDQDPDLIAIAQRTAQRHRQPTSDYIVRNAINWTGVAAAVPGWAAKVFPNDPPDAQEAKLWQAIFEFCRLNRADPVAAWQDHVGQLAARSDYLNRKRYTALKYTAPGTDLMIGLPKGHVWMGSGRSISAGGIAFTANLPTEEVFTLPDKDRAEGVVRASKPLSYAGALIENFSLTFAEGRVVNVTAGQSEAILRKLVETDEGAGRLGEVSLVPHSSPISRSGLLFYNTLIDENAASHIALGGAYKYTLQGGGAMSDEVFMAAGGNHSLVHVDFMIGSGDMDVDGLREDGMAEPIMRGGEWAFEM